MRANERQSWQQLEQLAQEVKNWHLKDLFAQDSQRFTQYSVRHEELLYDFSKQRITPEIMAGLQALAEESQLDSWKQKLLSGEAINHTEGRAVLHTALRQQSSDPIMVDGEDVIPAVRQEWAKMARLVNKIHAKQWRGYTGKAITDVVNIGVGGSDLGPLMAVESLEEFKHPDCDVAIHFVSNLDGRQLQSLMKHELNPETTLFIVASKSFTTIDTLSNADTAREWLMRRAKGNEEAIIRQHFIGVSTKPDKMTQWGIHPDSQFIFWDWVGGRYSLWSTIGLPIAIWLGMETFMEFLKGADSMDRHFKTAPFAQNIPTLMGLTGVWNHNFLGTRGLAILPYDVRLGRLHAYFEQLVMESNGKSVTREGDRVDYLTCPILWGEVGPNAQHAFYQLLHQGTEPVVCDFIATIEGRSDLPVEEQDRGLYHQNLNLANCLAQSQALAFGQDSADPHRFYPGNQVSNTLLFDRLTPYNLGMLIALYEHKVFVQSVIWNINAFDQWGVELGKKIAMKTLAALDGSEDAKFDDSTNQLIATIVQKRAQKSALSAGASL